MFFIYQKGDGIINSIRVKKLKEPYSYNEDYLIIDNIPITKWFENYADADLKKLGELGKLCPAWISDLDYKGDIRFIWSLIDSENPEVVPLLLCQDDLDFSCIVLVAYVRKDSKYVYWDKIGIVTHINEDFEEEKRKGILCVESYTDEDWKKYGDNIATESVNSDIWCDWISKNWEEELYRRRMNYTRLYYKRQGSVKWLYNVLWTFNRKEYEKSVNVFRSQLNK